MVTINAVLFGVLATLFFEMAIVIVGCVVASRMKNTQHNTVKIHRTQEVK